MEGWLKKKSRRRLDGNKMGLCLIVGHQQWLYSNGARTCLHTLLSPCVSQLSRHWTAVTMSVRASIFLQECATLLASWSIAGKDKRLTRHLSNLYFTSTADRSLYLEQPCVRDRSFFLIPSSQTGEHWTRSKLPPRLPVVLINFI